MNKKTSKKAQGMSINIVIIIVLSLLALAVVAYFFIGGFESSGDAISETAAGAKEGLDANKITSDLDELSNLYKCKVGEIYNSKDKTCNKKE